MRQRMTDSFAPGGDLPPIQRIEFGHWAIGMLDKIMTTRTGMCQHLERTPAQPTYITPSERFFRCENCYEQNGLPQARAARADKFQGLGAIEEGTCDRCMTYVGADKRTCAVVRHNLRVLVMGLCSTCTTRLNEGGQMVGR